ncbi:integrase core domain-containing protein [Streptomyces sp. 3214.6]|uniref:integrase core domain-containing protein n=1 Tax=Streptomyces sp. 3214.6 TaxID=1882757 RepID=UPI0013520B35|nr:integrase core domain-containing protein [Streptomyces sp. 3214.6]
MGRAGSALDNAAAKSFHSVLKVEYVHRHVFATRAEARLKIATWIADFYNTRRRHSAADGETARRVRTDYPGSTGPGQ